MKKLTSIASVVIAATLTVALSACAGGPKSYDSIEDLRNDVEAAGIICDNWFDLDATPPATASASCNSSTTIVIYSPGSDVATEAQETVSWYNENEMHYGIVYGPNWLVNVGEEAPTVAAVLHGESLVG